MSWYEKILEGKLGDETATFNIEESANLNWIANQVVNNSYQLIEDNRTIGSLVFSKGITRFATGKIYGMEFKIQKHWLYRNRILIEQTGMINKLSMEITDFHKSGVIKIDNSSFFWNCFRKFANEWAFSNEHNKKLIVFKPITSFYKSGYFVKIKSRETDKRSIKVLLLLGIYNLTITSDETGIASTFI